MKITTEPQPERQVLLEIEVEPERVEKSMDQAYRRLVGRYRIPGFRPGKAPRVMFERYVGREALLREALENLVPQIYDEAIKEESLDPIDQPQFQIETLEPLTIKATVPLRPSVDLGDWRGLRVERPATKIEADAVDKAIEELRRRYATLEPVERSIQLGDVVRADLTADVDDRRLLDENDAELRVMPDALGGLPGLAEKLVGCHKGESYDFEVDVPEDFDQPTLAGKQARYHVEIKEIKEEHLPETDDAFASEVGEGFASIAALRERIEADLRERAQKDADRDYERDVLQALIGQATIEYPPVLIERELDHMINEQSGGGGRAALEAALRRAGRTEEQLKEELKPAASERVERSLVLTELAQREGIVVSDEDVAHELDTIAGPPGPQSERMRELFSDKSGREFIERTLLTRKVYDRLRDIAEGKELPPLPEPQEAEQPSEQPASAEEGASQEVRQTADTLSEAEAQPDAGDGGQPADAPETARTDG
jgi:trigger factor